MDSLIGSDPKIVFAFWLGVVVTVMTVVMLTVILVMRQLVLRRERIHARAVELWKQVLTTDADPTTPPPVLRAQDLSGFLEVWNDVHEPLHGGTTPRLSRIAGEVGLEKHLYRILAHRGFHKQLIAIIALGHVKNSANFHRIEGFLDDRSPIVSLCAARALMQIDPSRAASMFVPQIVRRQDWSQGSIATILREVSDDHVVARELSEATLQAHAETAPRLVRLLASVNPQVAGPIIRRSLSTSSDERLMSTCLQVMANPADLDLVRPLLTHARWHVRMQAAVTLGRLGGAEEAPRLVDMLVDEQWWVRYRAAQGLLKLPSVDVAEMRRIQQAQTDKYARDVIDHVLAERQQAEHAPTVASVLATSAGEHADAVTPAASTPEEVA